MRLGPFGWFEFLVLFVALILPIWATIATLTTPGLSTTNRLLFLLVTWLIAIIGPIITLSMLKGSATDNS